MVAGPLILFSPLIYLAYRQTRKRTRGLQHVCEALGFTFEDRVRELGARFGEFPQFARGGRYNEGANLMTGSLAGHPVTVMDHYYGSGRSGYRTTLAVFPDGAKGLPDFELAPEHATDRILSAFGYQDSDFSADEEFSKYYLLRGKDEAAIRRAFGPTTLAFFAANRGWSVQTRGGAEAIYRDNRLCKPAEVPSFLAEALKVLGAFTQG